MGRPGKGLSLVGLHTLTDDLDPAEIAALAALIGGWRDRPVLRLTLDALWPLWATDDLVLDGGVLARVPLRRVPGRD